MSDPSTDPATTSGGAVTPLPAGEWTLDPDKSSAEFAVKHFWGLITVRGHFNAIEGELSIDPAGAVAGELRINAASVDTGNKQRDKHLRSADFFGADEHPQVVYTPSAKRRPRRSARPARSPGSGPPPPLPNPRARTRRPSLGAADSSTPPPVIPYSRDPSGAHVNATTPDPSGARSRPPVNGNTNGPRSDPSAAVVAYTSQRPSPRKCTTGEFARPTGELTLARATTRVRHVARSITSTCPRATTATIPSPRTPRGHAEADAPPAAMTPPSAATVTTAAITNSCARIPSSIAPARPFDTRSAEDPEAQTAAGATHNRRSRCDRSTLRPQCMLRTSSGTAPARRRAISASRLQVACGRGSSPGRPARAAGDERRRSMRVALGSLAAMSADSSRAQPVS